MNAPVNPAAHEAPLEYIPLGSITPSETHIQKLRRARYNMEALADLRSSIQKLGIQQPGVVRKLKAMRGLASYELVAGERRFRAAAAGSGRRRGRRGHHPLEGGSGRGALHRGGQTRSRVDARARPAQSGSLRPARSWRGHITADPHVARPSA